MKRLYLKIYLTIIASLVLVVAISSAFWKLGENALSEQAYEMAAQLAEAALPPADAPAAVQRQSLQRFAERINIDIALFDRNLQPVASVGRRLPQPPRNEPGMSHGRDGPVWNLQLPDQRWLAVRPQLPRRHPAWALLTFIGTIALVVGICAYPMVRGLTRRIERLQAGVETLGAGNLSARVEVKGRDEVAQLAESFNRAASRIEDLVGAHRMLLANASHELRTPLSRIRLGIELFERDGDPKYKASLERDIAELDALIDEILLTSRLDAVATPDQTESVDLLALAVEEAAHYEDCSVDGTPVTVRGDPRLLRRAIRNLLENARRHGKPPIRVALGTANGHATVDVIDAGAGPPEGERERVFAPFHRLGDNAGAGLGLALVRQIARLHGGDAVVATRTDAASCFRVTLPLG